MRFAGRDGCICRRSNEPLVAQVDEDSDGTQIMHTHTVRTRFTFGDHVKYRSRLMGCAGSGIVVGITIFADLPVAYEIDPNVEGHPAQLIQPGILEDEMELVDRQERCP